MKHPLFIIIAAVLLCRPLHVHAVRAASYTEVPPHGIVRVELAEGDYNGFLLLTREEVTAADIAAVKGVAGAEQLSQESLQSHEWSAQLQTLFALHGKDACVWLVTLKPAYTEILTQYAQEFTLALDGALDAALVTVTNYGYGQWNGKLRVSWNDTAPNGMELSEQLMVEHRAEDFWLKWLEKVTAWNYQFPPSSMTEEDYWMSRSFSGIPSDYEMVQAGETFAEEVRKIYGTDRGVTCYIDFQLTKQHRAYEGVSVWEGFGDCSGDGAVNAQDAARILQIAAHLGANRQPQLSEQEREYADFNRDGSINATDAGTLLRYAAGYGSGEFTGIPELLG
ncbi:MAG: hypothetical protein E7502_03050 [Ruminococcus sp.]|nr:hypothetical protein [Ruminococcus sp.]